MGRITLINLIAALNLICLQPIKAEIKLPAIVSSNMVLQRNTTIVLWGWADAKENITITASWLEEAINIQADTEGNWRLDVQTTNSKNSQSITLSGIASEITLENILFGEVWLCSGQSNMQQPMEGYQGQPTFGAVMAAAKSNNPNLRLFSVERNGSKTPLKEIKKFTGWQQASPDNVPKFSAVAYFYGQQLQEILDCPVGLIHTSYGGSSVQAWMSKEVLNVYETITVRDEDVAKSPQRAQTALFNAMINPLIPYTIKGVLWYQGESNRLAPVAYKKLFPAMVKDWRTLWNIGDFPFYYVQIAPFLYGNNEVFQKAENAAFMREAQLQCLGLIPNSGIAITMDIGEENYIHPPKKKEVADRLLLNALHQTYGYTTMGYGSPIYDASEVTDGGLLLTFKNAANGLFTFYGLEGFEIAGENKVFYPATAKIIGGTNILAQSDKVPNPVAVRYAWRNWVQGTLYDTNLLPASSFRTDDWDDATRSKN